jgi:hypothetical protein
MFSRKQKRPMQAGETATAVEMGVNPGVHGVHAQGEVVANPAALKSPANPAAPVMATGGDMMADAIYADVHAASWNSNMLKRWTALMIASAPYGSYTYWPTASYKPMVSLLLAVVPACAVLWQCYKWGAFSSGCSLTPPSLMYTEFDSVVMRALKDINPRFFWLYWAWTPIIGLLSTTIVSFYVDGTAEDATLTLQAVMADLMVWAASGLCASIGAASNVSTYQEKRWEDVKAVFATTHNAPNLTETFERIAMENAAKQTHSVSVKATAVIMGLMPAIAAAIRTHIYVREVCPDVIAIIAAAMVSFCIFVAFWGFFQWALIALMDEVIQNQSRMRAPACVCRARH